MDYRQRTDELIELAFVDESEEYEVDENGIYFDPKASPQDQFVVIQASGCSCWDGEYEEHKFPTMEAVEAFLTNDESKYHPSLSGVKALLRQAKKKIRYCLVDCIWRVKGIENGERERIKDLESALAGIGKNALTFWM